MDFGAECRAPDGHGRYEQLDGSSLPPLVIAWRADASEESGGVHAPLRERFDRGEDAVVSGMVELGAMARGARHAIETGDDAELRRCVDASFDARSRMLELDPRHVEMIECARAHGAAANYTGSGGAIIAVCRDSRHHASVLGALRRIGAQALAPSVAGINGS
jgi:glucuronokinase